MPTYNKDAYDISRAFGRIEQELLESMMRNMERHKTEELDYGFDWPQWQALQLQELRRYRKENKEKFQGDFDDINKKVEDALKAAYASGQSDQEAKILEQIRSGKLKANRSFDADFFRLNNRRMDALVDATTKDIRKAEQAVLRMANDKYRQIIFDAQVYFASGAGTYEKAVDMATHDFLMAGLNCIEYKNGARHTISDYAEMVIRTSGQRAYLRGEGQKRNEWGVHTVIVNKRGNPCPKCAPWCGKVMIDDVYAGGGAKEAETAGFPRVSTAMQSGFLHPRCKDTYTTWFPGISQKPKPWTKEELAALDENARLEAQQMHAERQAEKYERLAGTRLDPENRRQCEARSEEWKQKFDELTERRKRRLSERNKASEPRASGIQFDDRISEQQRQLIEDLSSQYNTRLQRVGIGAEKAAGDVDVSGSRMRLSAKHDNTTIHEFAHTLANSKADKYGLTHDLDFWKEIKKIRRDYMKAVESDPSRWISTYEHSSRSIDEFMAEAFTHAKMHELGLPIPSKYGSDFTYSQKVLDVIDKYFHEGSTLSAGIKNDTLQLLIESSGNEWFKNDPYEIIGSFKKELMELFEDKVGRLQTDEVIVMEERLTHIKSHHPQDYELFGIYGEKCIFDPDMIITDDSAPGTVLLIKQIENTNVSAVTRLSLTTDQDGYKNSIITFHRMRKKSVRNKVKKGRIIYDNGVQ